MSVYLPQHVPPLLISLQEEELDANLLIPVSFVFFSTVIFFFLVVWVG